jgi:hypothetical protein
MRQTSPSTLVATWTGLIKALQQHADTPGSGSRAAVSDGLNNVWRIMANTMELPHAALKTLVEDAQVCWHI